MFPLKTIKSCSCQTILKEPKSNQTEMVRQNKNILTETLKKTYKTVTT